MASQKIKPCLWFDGQAEEAARFYVSVFPASSLGKITPGPGGQALVVEFTLAGVEFLGLNGGPMFKFNEAVSILVDCEAQQEVDRLWEQLTEGGEESQCGWLKDRYGLSWQIVPQALPRLMADPSKAGKVMGALMTMKKIDIRALEAAARGD